MNLLLLFYYLLTSELFVNSSFYVSQVMHKPDAELMRDEVDQSSIANLGEAGVFQLSFLFAKYKTPHLSCCCHALR